jgi:hypothetical protein
MFLKNQKFHAFLKNQKFHSLNRGPLALEDLEVRFRLRQYLLSNS